MIMQKKLLPLLFCLTAPSFFIQINAQQLIDKYLSGPLVNTTIGTAAHGLDQPRDLDFKPGTMEVWVINQAGNQGGSTVIYYNAGETNQSQEYRKDTHSDHFMGYPSAIAFAENGDWACSNEIQNSNFMGPALWVSDTAIYARVFQNGWAVGYPLGSHTDMLHQSPFAMGIAHHAGKAYWVADGQNGNICKYDFVADHSPGYDDHSEGKIWRYTDVNISRTAGIPGHMVLDKTTGWLYVVNAGTKQIFRMNTNTGAETGNLFAPNEYLASYKAVTGATKEIIDTWATQPCGIDIRDNRLIVSDHSTGEIRIYNTAAASPTLMGTISTNQPGIMGVKIGNDGKIWFVNKTQNTLVRIDAPTATNDAAVARIIDPSLYNFETDFYHTGFNICTNALQPEVEIRNTGSAVLTSLQINYTINGAGLKTHNWTGALAPGAGTTVVLPLSVISDGEQKLAVTCSLPNGVQDENTANDLREGSFRSKAQAASLPFYEGFESNDFPPAGWNNVGFNRYCHISRDAQHGSYASSNGSLKMDNSTGQENISGQADYFISPRIDLIQSGTGTTLDFEIAHAQYSSATSDRLEVLISEDCGDTWTSVYNKAGQDLATTSPSTTVFYPEVYQWRREHVNLDPFIGKEIMFMFKFTSGFGNNIYIDDIAIEHVPVGLHKTTLADAEIFPNPTSGKVLIRTKGATYTNVRVLNLIGKEITSEAELTKNAEGYSLDLSEQPSGTYFISITSETGTSVKKLILIH